MCDTFFFSFFPGVFCIGVMAQGPGAGHQFHLRSVALLVVCSGVVHQLLHTREGLN